MIGESVVLAVDQARMSGVVTQVSRAQNWNGWSMELTVAGEGPEIAGSKELTAGVPAFGGIIESVRIVTRAEGSNGYVVIYDPLMHQKVKDAETERVEAVRLGVSAMKKMEDGA